MRRLLLDKPVNDEMFPASRLPLMYSSPSRARSPDTPVAIATLPEKDVQLASEVAPLEFEIVVVGESQAVNRKVS